MLPLIVGMSGLALTAEEKDFFRDIQPWGYILFKRNCATSEGVRALTDSLREISGNADTPILIDQEGGRVARLKDNAEWRAYPPGGYFGQYYGHCPETSLGAVTLNASLQAAELRRLGVNVNCAPMIDVRDENAHDIIGDRAFSQDPEEVAAYGRAVMKGLNYEGVLPIIKHIPGHGRARADSHETLPRVTESREALARDFHPFKVLSDAPMAMTAHILYEALDAENCATLSPSIIADTIRGEIGFDNLLMTDDLSMKALSGDMTELTQRSIAAGCDLILHCNGDMAEMQAIAKGLTAAPARVVHKTARMFEDLRANFSPRSEADLLEEFAEITAVMERLGKAA